jgi:hypothetical protein
MPATNSRFRQHQASTQNTAARINPDALTWIKATLSLFRSA